MVELTHNEKALNVPIDKSLRDRVKAEARANGLRMREAVRDALILWLHTLSYLREEKLGREEDRAVRREELSKKQ